MDHDLPAPPRDVAAAPLLARTARFFRLQLLLLGGLLAVTVIVIAAVVRRDVLMETMVPVLVGFAALGIPFALWARSNLKLAREVYRDGVAVEVEIIAQHVVVAPVMDVAFRDAAGARLVGRGMVSQRPRLPVGTRLVGLYLAPKAWIGVVTAQQGLSLGRVKPRR